MVTRIDAMKADAKICNARMRENLDPPINGEYQEAGGKSRRGPGRRPQQVLDTLAAHGWMTSTQIAEALDPPVSANNATVILNRLFRVGKIRKKYAAPNGQTKRHVLYASKED